MGRIGEDNEEGNVVKMLTFHSGQSRPRPWWTRPSGGSQGWKSLWWRSSWFWSPQSSSFWSLQSSWSRSLWMWRWGAVFGSKLPIFGQYSKKSTNEFCLRCPPQTMEEGVLRIWIWRDFLQTCSWSSKYDNICHLIQYMPSDTLFGDDFYCICFDHPNRETAMLSRGTPQLAKSAIFFVTEINSVNVGGWGYPFPDRLRKYVFDSLHISRTTSLTELRE